MCAAEKKEKSEPTLGGALIAGVINMIVGVAVAFCVLAGTAPIAYTPTPKKPGDPPPPTPAGVWYWAGTQSGGDWRGKEALFLEGAPVALAEADLNIWAGTVFKALPTAPAAAGPGAAAAAAPSFKMVPGAPNFRSWHGKDAPQGYFQVALPLAVTVLGFDVSVIYQARGTFVSGPHGPEFQPFYSSFGSARLPALGGLSKLVFDRLVAEYTPADAVKKYSAAWSKYGSADPQDGQLALGRQ